MPTKNRPISFSLNQEQHALLLSSALEGESPGQTARRFVIEVLTGSRLVYPKLRSPLEGIEDALVPDRKSRYQGSGMPEPKGFKQERVVVSPEEVAKAEKSPGLSQLAKKAERISKMEQGLTPDQWNYAQRQRDELDELDDVMPFGADPDEWKRMPRWDEEVEGVQGVPRWDEELET